MRSTKTGVVALRHREDQSPAMPVEEIERQVARRPPARAGTGGSRSHPRGTAREGHRPADSVTVRGGSESKRRARAEDQSEASRKKCGPDAGPGFALAARRDGEGRARVVREAGEDLACEERSGAATRFWIAASARGVASWTAWRATAACWCSWRSRPDRAAIPAIRSNRSRGKNGIVSVAWLRHTCAGNICLTRPVASMSSE